MHLVVGRASDLLNNPLCSWRRSFEYQDYHLDCQGMKAPHNPYNLEQLEGSEATYLFFAQKDVQACRDEGYHM